MAGTQKGKSSWIKHLDFILLDTILLQVSFVFTYLLRFQGEFSPYAAVEFRNFILLYTVVMIGVCIASSNYSGILRRTNSQELVKIISMTIVTMFTTAFFMYFVKFEKSISRVVFFGMSMSFAGFDLAGRCLLRRFLYYYYSKHPDKLVALVIVADTEHALAMVEMLRTSKPVLYNIKGVILTDDVQRRRIASGVPVVATISDATEYICHAWVDEVLVCSGNGTTLPSEFFTACADMGVAVNSVINIKDIEKKKVSVSRIAGHTVLRTTYNYVSPAEMLFKRTIDVVGGIVGSILALLAILIFGPIIYIKSPGPIIFKQERIGKNGKRFCLYKLRSMYLDAEERKKDYLDQNRVADGMMFKLDFDPRIIGNREMPDGRRKTGIGEFIRRTSIDELPQFFNVIRGEMSIVGTRPPTVDEWEKYEFHHRARMNMKPGITGLWQVSGRSTITDFEEVVKLDTEYITTFSVEKDIEIILKTIVVVFKHKGAM